MPGHCLAIQSPLLHSQRYPPYPLGAQRALDATGLFALEEIAKQLHATKRTLILCGAREQPSRLIQQAGFAHLIGPENICENVQEALRRAEEVYDRLEAACAVSGS